MEERKVAGIIADEVTAANQTQEALDEIMGISSDTHQFIYEKMLVEKDGQLIEIEVPIDDIDLLDDMDDDDLTEEGERSLGIINQDYDSTSGNAPDKKSRQKMLKGSVKTIKTENDDQDDYEITCPYTGSTEVYQVSSNVFASYETDQPFSVDFDEED